MLKEDCDHMVDYLSISIAFFSLVLGSALAIRFKVPSVIIFLILGAVVGTYGIIGQNSLFSTLGELGSILLLFAIGTEFSLSNLVRTGIRKAAIIASAEILISFVLLFLVFSTKLDTTAAMLLALAFSITSTGVTIKLFQELSLRRFDISLIVKVSIIEDLIAVFAFSAISSLAIVKDKTLLTLGISFGVSILLFVLAYYFFSILLTRLIYRLTISEDDVISIVLGVLLLFVYISTSLGLSAAFGAYIAGNIVSSWKKKFKNIDDEVRKFSYLFIAFFFFTIGLEVNLHTVDYLLLLLIIPIVLIIKFIGVYTGSYLGTKSPNTSLFTSIGMLSIGELSLVIVNSAVSSNLIPSSFLGLAAFTVFFSAIFSYLLLMRSEHIYNTLKYKLWFFH